MYVRNIGRLGEWRPELDWAMGDYKFKDWFGIRAGKVKTPLGLFNDTQDMEFLHTWAILPQSSYPLDLRSSVIAHIGGDIYGTIPLKRAGSLGYTAYAGLRPDDAHGGVNYVLADYGIPLTGAVTGRTIGGDLRWNSCIPGLTLGASWLNGGFAGNGVIPAAGNAPIAFDTKTDTTSAFYADYMLGNLRTNAEYHRNWSVRSVEASAFGGNLEVGSDQRGMYAAIAYRVFRRLELGTYHSRYYADWKLPLELPSNHIYDQTVTARMDINSHWNVKVEGHFLDGYGAPASSHGFYNTDNPDGLKPKTKMIVFRTGFNF